MGKSIRRSPRSFRYALDDGDAFLPDFRHGFVEATDGDVEALGEEFIAAATSAEAVGEVARDESVDDGFFVVTFDSDEKPRSPSHRAR